jgi:hypothetical protein
MTTPPHAVAFRAVTVVITLLVLLCVGLGLAGHGPASGLSGLVSGGAAPGRVTYVAGTGS